MSMTIRAADQLHRATFQRSKQLEEPAAKPLFNGYDLGGWHDQGDCFFVYDGKIVADSPGGASTVLKTDKKYKNFILKTKFWADNGTDGGIFLRGQDGKDLQIRIDRDSREEGAKCIGGLYGENCGDYLVGGRNHTFLDNGYPVFKDNQWNDLGVKVEGDQLSVWLNGVHLYDYTLGYDAPSGEGYIGLQCHGGDTWEPGKHQKFKDMTIEELA